MDPLLIYELYERNPNWVVIPLHGDKGIFVGTYEDYVQIIDNTNLSEEYYEEVECE